MAAEHHKSPDIAAGTIKVDLFHISRWNHMRVLIILTQRPLSIVFCGTDDTARDIYLGC